MISPAYADRSEWDFGQYLDFLMFFGLCWVRGRVFRYDNLKFDTNSTRRIDPRHPDSPNTSYLETSVTCIFRFSGVPPGGRRRRRRRRKNFSTTTSPSPIMHGDPISRSASPSLRSRGSNSGNRGIIFHNIQLPSAFPPPCPTGKLLTKVKPRGLRNSLKMRLKRV